MIALLLVRAINQTATSLEKKSQSGMDDIAVADKRHHLTMSQLNHEVESRLCSICSTPRIHDKQH